MNSNLKSTKKSPNQKIFGQFKIYNGNIYNLQGAG